MLMKLNPRNISQGLHNEGGDSVSELLKKMLRTGNTAAGGFNSQRRISSMQLQNHLGF